MIGIFGGTFDPVHLGHLGLADVVTDCLGLDRVIFVPAGLPVHRGLPKASRQSRVRMLQAALTDFPNFGISTVEVDKSSPSWTVDTLQYFCSEIPGETFCLLIGSDAFKSINQWYRWDSLLDYCHLVVVSRAGDTVELSSELVVYLEKNQLVCLHDMINRCHGGIYWLQATIPDISSTQVRQCASAHESLAGLLSPAVESLIKKHGYYGY